MPPTTTTMKACRIQSSPMVALTPTKGPNSTPDAAAMPGAHREHAGQHQRHRNAHRLRHGAVLRRGADPDAELAVFEEEPDAADDRGRQNRDQHAVPRIDQIEERELPGEGLPDLARDGAELPQRVILQDERDAEGREDGVERIAAQERAQCHDVDDGAEQRHHQRRRDQRQPEIAGRGHGQHADIGAQHEQFAMREIDHVHDAEDERQARGDERQDHAGDDAVQRLDQDLLQHGPRSPDTDARPRRRRECPTPSRDGAPCPSR